jgi:hypothetical protein
MKLFRVVWNDIRAGQNIDIYITVGIAIAVAILGVLGIANSIIIASATLAILALMSVNLLLNRYENENIRKLISQQQQSTGLAEKFLKPKYRLFEVKQHLISSQTAFFWGADLARTIPLLDYEIIQGLRNGLQVKFLFIKPGNGLGGDAVRMASFRYSNGKEISAINQDIERNFRYLATYQSSTPHGRIEVRVIDYLPPWTIIAVNPFSPTGAMFVHLTAFRVPNEVRPSFELSASDDEKWFTFFLEQFESVWEVAEPINLDRYKA